MLEFEGFLPRLSFGTGWADVTEPETAKTKDTRHERNQDLRVSLAESLVIPREFMFEVVPLVPSIKDWNRSATQPDQDKDKRPESVKALASPGRTEGCETNSSNLSLPWIDDRPSTAGSGEIHVAIPASILTAVKVDTTPAKRRTATMHPLGMSPPSLAESSVQRDPTPSITIAPQIPPRPFIPRLSALARREDLTTNRVTMVDGIRPSTSHTANSQPHPGRIATSNLGRIKYGRGKYAGTELVPQPSDDPRDPLNWQTWRKDLNLYALLMTAAMSNVMKTALITVNNPLAQQYAVSYSAVAALTGVPLMLSALTGLGGSIAARFWGRRPVYLVSTTLIFIGLVWNTNVTTSYGQFMAARIFQGLGWGAFDTLVVGSIQDTYFEHERSTKNAIHRIVNVTTLWGPPIIGGITSQNAHGFSLQFEILAFFQLVSIPLIVLGAPETMYARESPMREKSTPGWSPRTGWPSLGLQSSTVYPRLPQWARGRGIALDRVWQYARSVAPPASYSSKGGGTSAGALLCEVPRALVAPTTVLSFLATFLPASLLWGLAASLSGVFSPPDTSFGLRPVTVGALLATPFILATLAVCIFALWSAWSHTTSVFDIRSTHVYVLACGSLLSFVGILGFGLYAAQTLDDRDRLSSSSSTGLRFSALSFILGLLAAGAYVLDAPTKPLVLRSTRFTAPNLGVALRAAADMEAGVAMWRALFAGIFVMAIPAATVSASSAYGLRSTSVGVAVVQLLVVAALAAVWWLWDEGVRRWDGKVLGFVQWRNVGASGSYFEIDD